MNKILILGDRGMLGSMVVKVFKDAEVKYDIINHDFRSPGLPKNIYKYEWIINCIGKIKPTIDENNASSVWQAILINSELPYKLQYGGVKIIQIATDCVFDGSKGKYTETDLHNATDVYGKTKSLGEVKGEKFYNIRCSIIGPEFRKEKRSLFEWFMGQEKNASIKGFTNHMWNGVTTYQFAKLCLGIIKENYEPYDLLHFVPADMMMKSALLKNMADIWGRKDLRITETKAPQKVDRTLATNHSFQNEMYWRLAGYKTVPTIRTMLEDLHNYLQGEK